MFEYKVVTRYVKDNRIFVETAEGEKDVGAVPQDHLAQFRTQEAFLNQMSQEGWDLVTILEGTRRLYVFRREVVSEGRANARNA